MLTMFTVQLLPLAVNTSLSELALRYTSVIHIDAQIIQSKEPRLPTLP